MSLPSSLRRHWPLAVALLILGAGILAFAGVVGFVWLYWHRADYPLFYTLRPYLEIAVIVPCLSVLGVACGYGVFQRRLNNRPRWFKPRRDAFTLVEMIVVMFIMGLMAALGIAFLPRFLDNQMQTRAVDQLTQWLLTAKQRAKRDGVPTGLRLLQDPSTGLFTQLEYVQQPEPYTGGLCRSVNATNDGGVLFSTVTLDLGGVDFEGAATISQLTNYIVQPGDFLELNGGGPVYLIQKVNARTLTLVNTQVQITAPTPNYRVIRQPRRLPGEDVLTLPQDMIVDFSTNPATGNPYSLNVPQRSLATVANVYEIVFAPSGAVLGQGTTSGKIILWVRNATKPQGDPGAVTLVTIQIRTGQIAAHPISLGSDPYLFTEDGRSSGL